MEHEFSFLNPRDNAKGFGKEYCHESSSRLFLWCPKLFFVLLDSSQRHLDSPKSRKKSDDYDDDVIMSSPQRTHESSSSTQSRSSRNIDEEEKLPSPRPSRPTGESRIASSRFGIRVDQAKLAVDEIKAALAG